MRGRLIEITRRFREKIIRVNCQKPLVRFSASNSNLSRITYSTRRTGIIELYIFF